MQRTQPAARRQLDLLDAALAAREQRFHPAGHADDADRRHIAFEQRVGRLRRAVREEHDVFGVDGRALEHVAEHFDDAAATPRAWL